MKNRKLIKLLAVVLSLTFFMSAIGATTAFAAVDPSTNPALDVVDDIADGDVGGGFMKVLVSALDSFIRGVLNFLQGLFGDNPNFVEPSDEPVENFYSGISTNFKTSAAPENKWYLGYANASLVPEDYDSGEYYLGGYIDINNGFNNVVEDVVDDMKVRCIALKDSADGQTVLFATVDCIGMTNKDIRDIRALLADFATANNIAAINVAATHCHSCIDTEGLWTKNIYKLLVNGVNSATETGAELMQGTNASYMKFLKATVADALKAAYNDMKPGKLTYSQKDIGEDYFNNKNRPSATAVMTDLTRFVFTPDDTSVKPTMIVNIAAHPDVAGLPTGGENTGRKISGDYIYYAEELINEAGYNFMFFQGAIAGIYMSRGASNDTADLPERWEQSRRFGYEIARMALALNLNEADCKGNALLDPDIFDANTKNENGTCVLDDANYTRWNTGWTAVPETEVTPFLNLAIKLVEVPVSNDLIKTVGKLNLANYDIIATTDAKGNESYSIKTEVGYMELGNSFKTVFLPGEVCQDLIVGGDSLYADGSESGEDFGLPYVEEIYGEGTKCFGLMNDAIGYVVPDNDFTMGDPANHYHEFIGLGQYVGSSLIQGLIDLNDAIVRA